MGRATNTAMPAIALTPAVPALGHSLPPPRLWRWVPLPPARCVWRCPSSQRCPRCRSFLAFPARARRPTPRRPPRPLLTTTPTRESGWRRRGLGDTKVRAGLGGDATKGVNAPTLAEIQQSRATPGAVIKDAPGTSGWKAFPQRRMPGANMSKFRELAGEMKLPE
eukprot:TRINITY_DN448_c0_g1_i2.p3 TRINITY_DN448_c0_g1~~TRINITY_DN448_c0_g1_i2.p3  ORF type:complete len:165 (+),score=5.62 TRINITY_DN448_c0_g1_i2:467-961(+)